MDFAAPRLWRLVTSLSQRRSGFDPRPGNVRSVVAKWLWTSTSSRSSAFPYQYLSNNVTYSSAATCFSYEKDKGVKPGNIPQKQRSFVKQKALNIKVLSHI
jgi:hypothetical protein